MNDYTEGEYFNENEGIVVMIGENVWGLNPDASPRQLSLAFRKLVEEYRSKKPGGSRDKPAQ